jgi:hypothetical protein
LLLFTKEDNENGRRCYTSQIGNYEGDEVDLPSFICPNTNQPLPQCIFEKGCIIRIVMIDDLAFYAASLGNQHFWQLVYMVQPWAKTNGIWLAIEIE